MISSPILLSVLPLLPSGRLRRNVTRTLLILKRWARSNLHSYGINQNPSGIIGVWTMAIWRLYSTSVQLLIQPLDGVFELSPSKETRRVVPVQTFTAPRRARSPGLATAGDFGFAATLKVIGPEKAVRI